MDALSEAATIAVLAERVENLDEKLDSTRQRFDEHLEDEGIRFDVHAIREGKKAVLRMLSVGLFILGATGKWTLEHALTDWQTQHDPSRHKEIDP